MRINWFSNAPWASSGYGNQTRLFARRIKDLGHQVSITAFYGLEGAILNMDGMPIYPKGLQPYGQDIMSAHARNANADIIISLIDAWVIDPRLNVHGIPWVPWFPVDSEPLPAPVKRAAAAAFKRIVFSRFGEKMVHDAGLDCYYVPHGCDTNVYKPMDQAEARTAVQFPQDKFIVGMVAANKGTPSRKAFMPQLKAFAELQKRHGDCFLYLHTNRSERGEMEGVNLPEYLRFLGLQEGRDYGFPDPYLQMLGFPDAVMAAMYNAFDVKTLVSMGEGFGIPILEAQACGCPVVVGDWTSMGELCFSGWKVSKADAEPFWTPLAAYQYYPRSGAILEAYEAAYQMKGNQEYRTRAREGALAYDADRVTEKYWKPVLDDIGDHLADNAIATRKVAA